MLSDTDIKNWNSLSIAAQLGNIGSEVSRALKAQDIGNELRKKGALNRMQELYFFTKMDPKLQKEPAKLQEICRSCEVVYDYFYGDNMYGSTKENLIRYYDYFAIEARKI